MKWRLACSDYTFPLLAHGQALDLIAALEFDGVDIGLFEDRSHLQPSGVFRHIRQSARALRRALADRGLGLADVFLQTALGPAEQAVNHPDQRRREAARNAFLKCLEFVSECGGRHMSGLPGVLFRATDRASSFARSCEELAWRCERATATGIVFSVEAHIGSLVPTPAEALRLVRATRGLTLTLDYTHFTRRGIPDRAVEPLIPYASHFHARGARRNRLQAAMRDSTIDYGRILRLLKKARYKGHIGVEYVWTEWERCNEVDNLSETILLRDGLRKAMHGKGRMV